MLILEQSKNEEILYDNLKAHNHDVLWNHTLLNYQSNDNDYSIFFKKNADELEIIEAEYIVSCEGADSFFRKQLSVGFEGGTYESFNFVADVTLEWDKSYDKVLICMAQNTFASFFPMVGDKKYRIAGI
ncbi:MAG: FAD-dependent monooxygenase, partial [Segetibacter sp.]